MNKEEIKKILPHREPMLLVDEVELVDGVAHGKCHIRGDEYFLQGHFPGNPVVPGVIQCEMMAQSACVLLASGAAEGCTPMFTSLDKVKFRGQVKPGDTLETECEITRQRGNFYFAKGKGSVNGKVCVSAEFSFALVLIRDTALQTVPLAMTQFTGQFSSDYPKIMAAMLITMAPIVILYFAFSKQIIKGMVAGAVKG